MSERQDEVNEIASDHGIQVSDFSIPDNWIESFALSVGYTLEQYMEIPWVSENRNTYLLERGGCKAYSGMTGYSYVFRKDILERLQCFPYTTGYLIGSEDHELTRAVRALGLLSLCTYDKTTEHLGNRIDPNTSRKLCRYGLIKDRHDMPPRLPRRGSCERTERKAIAERMILRLLRHRYTQKLINAALQKLVELRSLRY
jgi:hypothetical protein